MIIEYQRNILADKVRNQAFYEALRRVVKPGHSVVADVGSGTGFLGFLASQLGAKAVHLIEYTPVIKLSQKLARQNTIPRCHFLHAHSTDVEKSIKADILISETLGNYAYEENIIETIEDAKRLLKPGGTIIPCAITQYAAPVIAPKFYQELCSWDHIGFGLDFAPAKEITLNNVYVRTFCEADLYAGRGGAQRWDRVEFTRKNKSQRRGSVQWNIQTGCTIYGLAVWWECELIAGINLSTSPFSNRTHWEQLYFPVLRPVALTEGDQLHVTLESDSRYQTGLNLKWHISVQRRGGIISEQSLDMRKGDVR